MKTIFRILVIFLFLTSNCMAYDLGDKFDKNDFTKYLDMGDGRIAYTLNNDTLNFHGIEADQIIYVFYKNKLYAKHFRFSIYEPTVTLENILGVLKDHYGNPITKRTNPLDYFYLTDDSIGMLILSKEFRQYEFTIAQNKMIIEYQIEKRK